nr:MAG TPA: motif TRP-interacting helix [Caudoviricetes sp.]
MVTLAILAAVMGISGAAIILTLYTLHKLTGGKMTLKKWYKCNFEF